MQTIRALLMMVPLAACGHDGHSAVAPDVLPDVLPDVPSTAATAIHISSDLAPSLVAFREGISGTWQPATVQSPTTFEAEVHGPYEVVVQCSDQTNGQFSTWEVAQTPDDSHDVAVVCAAAMLPVGHAVTGHMVQAGQITFGDDGGDSATANWDFNLSVASGSFDLMAVTATDIALRRTIAVAGDLALAPAIDLTHEGTPLIATRFSVTNTTPTESLIASVNLDNATLFDARIYRGPLATAMVAPDAVLVATDVQSASMQATDGGRFRALRKPFHAGDDAAFTLPAPNDVQFTIESGQLVAGWSALPPFDTFDLYANGNTASTSSSLDLEVSPAFVAATGVTHLALATDIPGYDATQGIDLAGPYTRGDYVQRLASGEVTTTSFDESVNSAAAARNPRGFTRGSRPGARAVPSNTTRSR